MTEAAGTGRSTTTVTVLFCDLVGSTERQSRLGDDANDEFRRRLFSALRAAVGAARGEVVKTIGDAVMAVFRASTVDGVTCAALMHRVVRALDVEHPARLRIGVSAGEAAEEDGDWFGTTVVEAARLEAIAAPEQTLAADVVRVLVGSRGGFEFRRIGERTLKGLPEPISVSEVIADESSAVVAAAADRMDGHTGRSGTQIGAVPPSLPNALAVAAAPIITGRSDELDALRAAWARACAPSVDEPRRVVMVSGEPGIGKTRVVAEFARAVAESGGHVHYGRCDENGAAPFLPWITVLDALIAETLTEVFQSRRADAAELQRLCPQIANRLDLPAQEVADLEGERLRLFAAIEHILIATSERSPTLIVVDDLHWADQSSLLLLARLASLDVAGRFLIVGTYRDTDLERAHPLSATLADLRRARRVNRVSLRCLDLDATATLIALRAGATPDTALSAAVFAETDGHPFFVEEVCAYLVETGRARVSEDGLTTAADLDQMGIPEGVRDVLGHRFERLSSPAIDAMRVAAVMGSVFDIAVLEELELERDAVLDGIEEATLAGLVRERDDAFGHYEFCHALVRNALVDEISGVRRVRLHRRIADAIERTRRDLTARDLDALAYHYAQAAADGDLTKAVEYACRSVEQAIMRAAYDEANVYLERAFEVTALARDDASTARAELLVARTELLWRTRTATSEDATEAATEAIAIARSVGAPALFAKAVCALGRSTGARVYREVVELVDEALEGLGDSDDALAIQLRGLRLFHRGLGGGIRAGDDAEGRTLVDAARLTGDADALIAALTGASTALRGSPDLDDRRRYAEEWIDVTTSHPDQLSFGSAYQVLASIDLASADRAGFLRDVAEYGRVRAEVGTAAGWAWDEIGTTTDALMGGRFTEADERITRFLHDDSGALVALLAQLLWLRAEQGRIVEIYRTLTGFAAAAETYPNVVPMLAFAHARLQQREQSISMLHPASVDDFAMLPRSWSWPVSLAMLAEAATVTGDDRFSTALARELEPYRGQLLPMMEILCVGAADRYLAMLGADMGRIDEAIAGFTTAYELEARYPAPPLMARTQYWHARTLATHADAHAEAERMLDECIKIAESLGMRDLAGDANVLRSSF